MTIISITTIQEAINSLLFLHCTLTFYQINFSVMKYKSIFKIILLGFCCAILATSCVKEGPMGPAGADGSDGMDGLDGRDGVDGKVSCLVCHSGDNLLKKQAQFVLSGHRIGHFTLEREEWGSSCVRCHTPVGFVQYAETGSVTGGITNTDVFTCSTCHGIHQTFESTDYALRTTEPALAIFDATVTFDLNGNNNICAHCHQSRRAEPNITNPGETFKITSTHYGPHHGPEANLLTGQGFAEIPGPVAYPEANSGDHLAQASCTGCHMTEFGDGEGGHSFSPSLVACNTCHGVVSKDFDYGGVQTDVERKLDVLRDKLIELGVVAYEEEVEYVWNPETQQHEPADDPVGSYHPVKGTYPMVQAQAFFNWIGILEDRSFGVHNPKYTRALLINSIEALK